MNLKLAFRALRKSPFITAAAILSLAFGIGANTAIFSIFQQVLLQELPVSEPGRLVNFSSPGPIQGEAWRGEMGGCPCVFSYPMFKDLERQQNMFTGIAAHLNFEGNLSYTGHTEPVQGLAVSGSYFQVLGLQPLLGRLFSPADDKVIDEPHEVVLSYDYWRSRFGENAGVLNQTLIINGQSMQIVGVAPKGFRGTTVGHERQVFVPMTVMPFAYDRPSQFQNRKRYTIYLFARLKTGVTPSAAAAAINVPYRSILNEIEAPLQKMSTQTLAQFKAKRIELTPGNRGQSQLPEETRPPLLLLAGATCFVLLIACSNVANILLARGAARASEMAVRLSIGASRTQLVAQLLVESMLLAALGGSAGLLVAQWTLGAIASLIPPNEAKLQYELDPVLLLFTAALTIGTGVLFGLFPALQSTRPDLHSGLQGRTGRSTGGRTMARLRTSLATAQIGLAMALLILAGLFLKSLLNINRENLGLKADHVVTFRLAPGSSGYTRQRTLALLERIEDAVGNLPGVTGITGSTVPLFGDDNPGNTIKVEGFHSDPDGDSNSFYTYVAPEYFKTLGIPLISGREFSRSDQANAPKVAVVNQEFAKKFKLGTGAIGKRIAPAGNELDTEIIGLVGNSKYANVKQEPPPLFFLPYRQVGDSDDSVDTVTFYARTSLEPHQFLKAIPPIVARIDPNVPVQDARTLGEQVQQNVAPDRLVTLLSAVFSVLATVLAAFGLYGVLAYVVAQRTREIGVRIALGAAPARIHGMVLRYVGWMTFIGGIAGLGVALGAGRLAESLLFQLNGHDPVVLGIAVLVLSLIAFGAGFVPAHRAANVDPMKALRYD